MGEAMDEQGLQQPLHIVERVTHTGETGKSTGTRINELLRGFESSGTFNSICCFIKNFIMKAGTVSISKTFEDLTEASAKSGID